MKEKCLMLKLYVSKWLYDNDVVRVQIIDSILNLIFLFSSIYLTYSAQHIVINIYFERVSYQYNLVSVRIICNYFEYRIA